MSKGTVYISGPMRGYPNDNYPAFNQAAAEFRAAGWDVRNPAEHFDGDHDREFADYMRVDIQDLLEVDTIYMMRGWRDSRGAKTELLIAQTLGLRVIYQSFGDHWKSPTVVTAVEDAREADVVYVANTREPV